MKTIMKFQIQILWVLAITTSILFNACKEKEDDPVKVEEEEKSYKDIKNDDWRNHIGDTLELTGFIKLNDDGSGVLFIDKKDVDINGLVDESRYIALGSENLRGLKKDSNYLSELKIRGVIRATTLEERQSLRELVGDISQFELKLVETPLVITPGTTPPPPIDPCVLNPSLCSFAGQAQSDRYALLYSGGMNPDKAYIRYWNDMVLYYNMLINLYEYDPDHIIVVYKDGVGEDNTMPVDFAANPAGVNQALTILENEMTEIDKFFFFTTNHGGTRSDNGSPAVDDESWDGDNTDETIFYYNSSSIAYDDDVVEWIERLSFKSMICVMEQCFSGGLIYDLRGENRFVMTAATETQVSYGGAVYDDFVMLLASALIGTHQLDNTPVDADANNDGKVSLTEAFRWASDNDTRDEIPQYEDSGEGFSVSNPTPNGFDGAAGSEVFGF
ncbi:hypothetical protein GYB22_08600 [bacterium]|nr:hypothetical protein [bacterium]